MKKENAKEISEKKNKSDLASELNDLRSALSQTESELNKIQKLVRIGSI